MTAVRRLITHADIDDRASNLGKVSVAARLELELTDGRRLLLLDDRGWGSTGSWAETSVEDIEGATRMAVGPDEPTAGRSQEEMETSHWAFLLQIANRQGVAIDAAELRRLPHDIVFSQRLLARIGTSS